MEYVHLYNNRQQLATIERVAGILCILLPALFCYNHIVVLSFSTPDDRWMLLKNPLVHPVDFSFSYLVKTFTSFNDIQYSPLNTIYYYLVFQINGFDPYYFHLFSFIFHLLNAAIIYGIAKEMLKAFDIAN